MNHLDCLPSDTEADVCQCADCSRGIPSCHCNRPGGVCHIPGCVKYKAPTPFSITGPGEYKNRYGHKVRIIEKIETPCSGTGTWVGIADNGAEHYYTSTYWSHGQRVSPKLDSKYDIISKWEEPRKPVEGWVNVYSGMFANIHVTVFPSKLIALKAAKALENHYVTTVKVRECPDT